MWGSWNVVLLQLLNGTTLPRGDGCTPLEEDGPSWCNIPGKRTEIIIKRKEKKRLLQNKDSF